MKKRVLAGAAALALGLTGVIGINQASADEGAVPSLTVRAVNTAQGDASAYLTAKCPEHTAKAVIKVGEWKTETINLKNAPSEFGYMISSNQGQAPTSLTCFDYQEQATNTTVTAAMARQIKPIFTEVVAAPAFAEEALEILSAKKNLRLLVVSPPRREGYEIKQVSGGAVIQERDVLSADGDDPATWTLAAGPAADLSLIHI